LITQLPGRFPGIIRTVSVMPVLFLQHEYKSFFTEFIYYFFSDSTPQIKWKTIEYFIIDLLIIGLNYIKKLVFPNLSF